VAEDPQNIVMVRRQPPGHGDWDHRFRRYVHADDRAFAAESVSCSEATTRREHRRSRVLFTGEKATDDEEWSMADWRADSPASGDIWTGSGT